MFRNIFTRQGNDQASWNFWYMIISILDKNPKAGISKAKISANQNPWKAIIRNRSIFRMGWGFDTQNPKMKSQNSGKPKPPKPRTSKSWEGQNWTKDNFKTHNISLCHTKRGCNYRKKFCDFGFWNFGMWDLGFRDFKFVGFWFFEISTFHDFHFSRFWLFRILIFGILTGTRL